MLLLLKRIWQVCAILGPVLKVFKACHSPPAPHTYSWTIWQHHPTEIHKIIGKFKEAGGNSSFYLQIENQKWLQCRQQDRLSQLQPCPWIGMGWPVHRCRHGVSNVRKRYNTHCRFKFHDFECHAVPWTSPFNCSVRSNSASDHKHNTPECSKWFPPGLERTLFSIQCMQGAEMSAAHKAFWLPLSQQSETANDLGLICVRGQ